MKLIAINTIHGAYTEPVLDAEGKPVLDSRKRPKHRTTESAIVPPGIKFDPAELGLSDKDVDGLLKGGFAMRKVRTVVDDDDLVEVAQNTAPRGPASGATKALDPAAVASGKAIGR